MAAIQSSAQAPLVSVIVPAWNAEATLGETLQSVAAQTYCNFEIVIVDDGSTDNTAAVAEHFCARERRARLVRKENGGVASARNRGIAEAGGDWIAPIDADDLWHPMKLERQVAAAVAAPEPPGFVYCWFHYIDGDSRVIGSSAQWMTSGSALIQLAFQNFVGNGSAPLLRRDAVLAAGGYDESLRARDGQGCEDLLLQLRIARDWPVMGVPEHLVGYRVQPGTMSKNVAQMARSWELVYAELERQGSVPRRVIRWTLGIRAFEFAGASAAAGDWRGCGRYLARALGQDPVRCGAMLAYRIARKGVRSVRGRRPRQAGVHFTSIGSARVGRTDPDELASFAFWLEKLDQRRLAKLAALDRKAAAQSAQSRPISR